jgi:hypothetical protein
MDPFIEESDEETDSFVTKYLRWIKKVDGDPMVGDVPRVMVTNGTRQNMVFTTPKISFASEQLFYTLKIYYKMDHNYHYAQKEREGVSETAQAPQGSYMVYMDDASEYTVGGQWRPGTEAEGVYSSEIALNCRGKDIKISIQGANMKHIHISGLEIKHEERGRRTFE